MPRLRLRVAAALERLRESLWLIPGAMVAIAAAVATILSREPRAVVDLPLSRVLLPSSANVAMAALQVVAGSVITVTSVVFSLTVVALQITAGNYSPRALRTFLRDFGTQIVLGTFLGTFAYTYIVLQNVRQLSESPLEWGPQQAFLGVLVFVTGSLVAFVFFIHHVTQAVRVDFILDEVLDENLSTIGTVHPDGRGDETPERPRDVVPDTAVTIAAPRSGYVQAFNAGQLLAVLEQEGLCAAFRPSVGDHVLEGATIAWVWPVPSQEPQAHVVDAVHGAAQIGRERSMDQDVAFGIRQLVDIAVRALSPGVNDPNTAISASLHLSVVYRTLLGRDLGPRLLEDGSGEVRVLIPYPSFEEYLSIMVHQIGHYGRGDRMVMLRLLRILAELKSLAPRGRHAVLDDAIDVVVREAEEGLDVMEDLELVRRAATDAKEQTFRFRDYTAAG